MADFSGVDDQQNTGTEGGTDEQQAPGLHPSWQNTFDAIPEDLRDTAWGKSLIEQINTSEKNARKAIDDAKGTGIPDEWAPLIQEANEQGLTPAELVDAFNSSTAMRDMIANDPDGFLDDLTDQIREAVKSGNITAKEGSKIMAGAQKAADEVDLTGGAEKNPEVEALRARLDARERADAEAQEAWQLEQDNAATIAEAEREGESFIATANATFEKYGLEGRTGKTKAIIAQVASDYLETTNATPEQALEQAVKDFAENFGLTLVAKGAAGGVPIGGGSAGVHVEGQKFESDKDRLDAMLAEATRQQNAGIN